MTDISAAQEQMARRFLTAWGVSGFRAELENEKFTPTSGVPWARMVFRNRGGPQNTFGKPGVRKFDRVGSMFVQVFTPLQEGTGQGTDLAQLVVDAFEGERIPGTSICFNEVIVRQAPPSGDWNQVTVEVNFRYTVIK